MNAKLEVFSDLSEELNYNLPDFPLYVRKGLLNQFDKYAAACHWHPDLEFILVLEGEMEYFVNGEIVNIEKGNGFFINSRRLHYGFSSKKVNCSFLVIAIHPALFGESRYLGKTYFEENFGSNTEDYILITQQSDWEKDILLALEQIYKEMNSTSHNALRLLSLAAKLCANISDHIQHVPGQVNENQSWIILRNMTGFIHHHYASKITLDEIAAAGSICRSKCCELFDEYTGKTPNSYLVRYRIQKSCEMLTETNRSVSEIAIRCGFQSASYFSYVFRNEIGLTPLNYRKNIRIQSSLEK
ncbi:AraC family transcriptional regulator [Paenibacillus riograndensis]|uniref:AraC family transcriptional regulator n=1 Tax=Paenibacillus riograndensis SBR5 TaxID=1073571 RepID=A0A0E3WHP6_9BACL|nr:AraC family transcriptional regulator [Paenibacillus riograndensis]CQR55653.1 AraC family transcriptional regulator [Paenibacillus riograndensis SBR5]